MKKISRLIVFALLLLLTLPQLAQGAFIHTVQPGESLFRIGNQYGVTVDQLVQENQLSNPNMIYVNQQLRIPGKEQSVTYSVKAGDSLYKIAQQFNIPMAAIAEANSLQNWNHLYVGQQLTIPGTSNTQPPQARTYQVQSGDTLYKISQRLGVTMNALAQENNLKNRDFLYVGQVLRIPSDEEKQPDPSFQYTMSQLAAKYPDTFFLRGSSNTKRIALTFDDGPDPVYTPGVLDVLKEYNVPATFFLMGSRAERHPAVVKRMVQEGHIIANHSWSHPDLRKISSNQLKIEMEKTEDILYQITGLQTALMRPPYGGVNQQVIENLRDMDYKVINWDVDSIDWRDQDVDKILNNTLPRVRGESILLFHSASGEGFSMSATVEALPQLINNLRGQGYVFVTVDQLLNIPAYR